jgi:hypothetical protein
MCRHRVRPQMTVDEGGRVCAVGVLRSGRNYVGDEINPEASMRLSRTDEGLI